MTTNTSKPTPLGTLIKLPTEVRDQIYDHVLETHYVVFWASYHENGTNRFRSESPRTLADLEIRCVSKSLSTEASARLFSCKTKLVFEISFNPYHDKLSPAPNKKATERMMNVEFRVQTWGAIEATNIQLGEPALKLHGRSGLGDDVMTVSTADGEVKYGRTLYHPSNMDPRCEASVDHFTGTEIERNELLVTFDDFDENFQHFMHTRFFQTLKKCIGFRSIAVVLEWWEMEGMSLSPMAVAEKVDEVQQELEQSWGPCVVTDALDRYEQKNDEDFQLFFAFELAFRPLKFHGENSKAEEAGVVKEGNRQEEHS